ncbi:hypothetical protein, partial [Escherichia coli]|uniref:hypothetical protein n=1 Tax=Escherichia coli TaxID=562 RepID=UPI003CE599F5
GIEIEIGEAEFIDQMLHAPAVLVAAMEHDDSAATLRAGGRPAAIEQGLAVVGGELVFLAGSCHGWEAARRPLRMRLTILRRMAATASGS